MRCISNKILVVLAALLSVACSADMDFEQTVGETTAVQMCVTIDSETRAVFGSAESIDKLYYAVYRVYEGGVLAETPVVATTTPFSNGQTSIQVMLVPQLNYKAFFWAYNSQAQWSTSESLSLATLTMPSSGVANSDMYDAFTGSATISAGLAETVTLRRPLAMLNACVPQAVWERITNPSQARVTVVVKGGALAFDAFTNTPLARAESVQTFTATGLEGELFEDGYRRLISCFLFPAESVEVVLTVEDGANKIIDQYVVEDVPLKGNRRTNLLSRFSVEI